MICRRVPWPRRVRLGVEVGSPVRAVAVRHFTLELDDLPAFGHLYEHPAHSKLSQAVRDRVAWTRLCGCCACRRHSSPFLWSNRLLSAASRSTAGAGRILVSFKHLFRSDASAARAGRRSCPPPLGPCPGGTP